MQNAEVKRGGGGGRAKERRKKKIPEDGRTEVENVVGIGGKEVRVQRLSEIFGSFSRDFNRVGERQGSVMHGRTTANHGRDGQICLKAI